MSEVPRDPIATEAEFLATLETMAPRLCGWAHLRLRGRPAADIEDFQQEVLCRALTHRDRFHGGDLGAWVFQIARHVLLESYRRTRRHGRVQSAEGHSSRQAALHQVPASISTMTRRVAERDEARSLLDLVEQLDETDRKIVALCGLEGESARTVAQQLTMGEEAVAKRWYRLRLRLRRCHGGDAD